MSLSAETIQSPKSHMRLRTEIIHSAVRGRARFKNNAFVLRDDRLTAAIASLGLEPGILAVRGNALTGTILVKFAPPLSITRIVRILDSVAADRHTPRPRPPQQSPRSLSAATATRRLPAVVTHWHACRIADIIEHLGSSDDLGLSPDIVAERLNQIGPNELRRSEPRSVTAIFAEQMTSLPVALLGASAGLSIIKGGLRMPPLSGRSS